MNTRRQFLTVVGSTGLAAWAAGAPSLSHALTGAASTTATGLVVIDQRLAGAYDAYSTNRPIGVPVAQLQGDVSHVWFTAIRPHMQQHGTPVAGLTQADALFCLQQLAADMRWRLARCEDLLQRAEVATVDLACSAKVHAWRLVPATSA